MDQHKLLADIEKYGWTIIAVEASDYLPSFAYTIGLSKNYQHPEIIIFGLPVNILHLSLNEAGALIKDGTKLETNKTYTDFFENGKTEFLNVDARNVADYFGMAIDFYKMSEIAALQLVWTDRNNKFPWEENFEEEFRNKQPLLDRNADFKFFEEKNLGIFTTKQFLEGKPILRVTHDEDGDWQFLTGDQEPEDAKLVCLEEMISRDPSLNDLFDLDYGQEAERTDANAKWVRKVS